MMEYDGGPNEIKIPTAMISVESAEMLHRMQKHGLNVTLKFRMDAENVGQNMSRNTIVDYVGYQEPDKVTILVLLNPWLNDCESLLNLTENSLTLTDWPV